MEIRLTPRERIIAALKFEPYEGPVPHYELEFQLTEEVFGRRALNHDRLKEIAPDKRRDALVANAQLWIDVAERFDYSVITGLHWLPMEEQIESFELVRELSGERFMLSAYVDGTQAIPDGPGFAELSYRIADEPEAVLAQFDKNCNNSIEYCRQLVGGGAEIIFMCADYCLNQGPFLSPRMFRKFVTPFLKRQTDAFWAMGAYPVKHTDGNMWPILDQLIETKPAAFHSIDPMAGMDIAKVRATVGRGIALMGNVDCSRLQSGTKEEIETSARYCLEHGPVDGTGYVFASSNCIFAGVPFESYLTMLAVRDDWNRAHGRG
jgi:uroporphyrinogen decarboxylase